MIDNIIRFSINNRLFIIAGVICLIFGGFYSAENMDIDVFPDLTAPTVVIMTDCQGMASEEVERLVTFPIETAVNGATNVRRVRSTSGYGTSFVWVEFDWGMDVFRARQIISEKMVALTEELPDGITPQMAPQSSVMGEILFIGLQTDSTRVKPDRRPTSMMELRSLADWVIKPAILATGGVSQVTIIGGDYKQYQVLADPLLMDAYDVTMDELSNAVSSMSQNTEGSVIRENGNEYALRGIGRTNDLEELSRTLVKSRINENGQSLPITVGDVARVTIGSATKMGTGSMNARPAIVISITKQPNINTLEVTEKIEENLESIRQSLPEDVVLNTKIFRQADFIQASVSNVGRALLEGAIFVIIVLFLFLGSFRTTLISVVASPLSLLGTLIVLWAFGMDINTMTLGGMCIAIGSLVDDAIIDVENVYKRLRQNYLLPQSERKNPFQIVFEASKEIRSSILNATFIVIVAFIPMFFLTGMEGRMLKPLGIAYIISLFMSLIVAMTITPLFCKELLTNEKYLSRQEKENRITAYLQKWYGHALEWVLTRKKSVVMATGGLLLAALLMFFTFGSSFLPDFNEGSLTISAVSKPGVSLYESDHLGNCLETELLKVPEIEVTTRRTGRGELDEHSQTTNSAEIDVTFKPSKRSKEEIMNDVRSHLSNVPGVATIVGQPLGHRIDHMLSGTRASIAIKLFGTNLSEMFIIGNRIKNAIEGIDGLVDINIDQQTETPQLHIRPNRLALARYGITMQEFNEFISLGFSGEKLGDIYEGQRSFDLVLKLSPTYTGSIDGVRKALIDTGNGRKIPLEEVCEIVSTSGPNNISRENVQRKLVLAANVSGRDVGSVVNDIRQTIESEITLPEGYRVEYGGQFESARNASRILLLTTFIALLVIYLLLYAEFRSFSLSAIVMAGLPLALIGGVLGIAISSWVVCIPSIIGFITLFGIATRNGILLISKYQHLQVDENKTLKEVILEGSKDRLNPIFMTALTSALALIPLILNSDKAGNEIQSPMAIVVLGGLLTSTILNIFIMPAIYEWHVTQKSRKA
ncbi:MAG: efflux RND transporter permease subunit [Bacteroidales bacterium]|nr:efflux RND transporter permease subunit [Bacteroidales bacterium]